MPSFVFFFLLRLLCEVGLSPLSLVLTSYSTASFRHTWITTEQGHEELLPDGPARPLHTLLTTVV